jgi:hypothetical protein
MASRSLSSLLDIIYLTKQPEESRTGSTETTDDQPYRTPLHE